MAPLRLGFRCARLAPMARKADATRRSRRHDADAGGPADVLAAKAVLRERVWADLDRPGVARFPKPANRIPNFVGAEAAAGARGDAGMVGGGHGEVEPGFAAVAGANARAGGRQGRLHGRPAARRARPFFLLDPAHLEDDPRHASSIKGAAPQRARTVDVDELEPVDLVVTGCVAVDGSGARLGKGGGFSDLELAIAAEAGLVTRARSSSRRCTTCRCCRRVRSR